MQKQQYMTVQKKTNCKQEPNFTIEQWLMSNNYSLEANLQDNKFV